MQGLVGEQIGEASGAQRSSRTASPAVARGAAPRPSTSPGSRGVANGNTTTVKTITTTTPLRSGSAKRQVSAVSKSVDLADIGIAGGNSVANNNNNSNTTVNITNALNLFPGPLRNNLNLQNIVIDDGSSQRLPAPNRGGGGAPLFQQQPVADVTTGDNQTSARAPPPSNNNNANPAMIAGGGKGVLSGGILIDDSSVGKPRPDFSNAAAPSTYAGGEIRNANEAIKPSEIVLSPQPHSTLFVASEREKMRNPNNNNNNNNNYNAGNFNYGDGGGSSGIISSFLPPLALSAASPSSPIFAGGHNNDHNSNIAVASGGGGAYNNTQRQHQYHANTLQNKDSALVPEGQGQGNTPPPLMMMPTQSGGNNTYNMNAAIISASTHVGMDFGGGSKGQASSPAYLSSPNGPIGGSDQSPFFVHPNPQIGGTENTNHHFAPAAHAHLHHLSDQPVASSAPATGGIGFAMVPPNNYTANGAGYPPTHNVYAALSAPSSSSPAPFGMPPHQHQHQQHQQDQQRMLSYTYAISNNGTPPASGGQLFENAPHPITVGGGGGLPPGNTNGGGGLPPGNTNIMPSSNVHQQQQVATQRRSASNILKSFTNNNNNSPAGIPSAGGQEVGPAEQSGVFEGEGYDRRQRESPSPAANQNNAFKPDQSQQQRSQQNNNNNKENNEPNANNGAGNGGGGGGGGGGGQHNTKVQIGMMIRKWIVLSRIGAGSFGETFCAAEVPDTFDIEFYHKLVEQVKRKYVSGAARLGGEPGLTNTTASAGNADPEDDESSPQHPRGGGLAIAGDNQRNNNNNHSKPSDAIPQSSPLLVIGAEGNNANKAAANKISTLHQGGAEEDEENTTDLTANNNRSINNHISASTARKICLEVLSLLPSHMRPIREVCIKVEQDCKNVLRLEVQSIRKCQECPQVVRIINSGHIEAPLSVNYLVMERLGPNLADLRRTTPNNVFDVYTSLRVGISCLKVIRSIHDLGLTHRDIKPSNFVVGLGPVRSKVCYLIDFGLARRFRRSNGQIRPPRENTGFRGTNRYASIQSHRHCELGRVDDLWSLLFMLVEMVTGSLPWRKYKDKDQIGECKMATVNESLVQEMPREFTAFLQHLQSLSYESEPNYDLLVELLETAIVRRNYNEDRPLNWERTAAHMLELDATEDGLTTRPIPLPVSIKPVSTLQIQSSSQSGGAGVGGAKRPQTGLVNGKVRMGAEGEEDAEDEALVGENNRDNEDDFDENENRRPSMGEKNSNLRILAAAPIPPACSSPPAIVDYEGEKKELARKGAPSPAFEIEDDLNGLEPAEADEGMEMEVLITSAPKTGGAAPPTDLRKSSGAGPFSALLPTQDKHDNNAHNNACTIDIKGQQLEASNALCGAIGDESISNLPRHAGAPSSSKNNSNTKKSFIGNEVDDAGGGAGEASAFGNQKYIEDEDEDNHHVESESPTNTNKNLPALPGVGMGAGSTENPLKGKASLVIATSLAVPLNKSSPADGDHIHKNNTNNNINNEQGDGEEDSQNLSGQNKYSSPERSARRAAGNSREVSDGDRLVGGEEGLAMHPLPSLQRFPPNQSKAQIVSDGGENPYSSVGDADAIGAFSGAGGARSARSTAGGQGETTTAAAADDDEFELSPRINGADQNRKTKTDNNTNNSAEGAKQGTQRQHETNNNSQYNPKTNNVQHNESTEVEVFNPHERRINTAGIAETHNGVGHAGSNKKTNDDDEDDGRGLSSNRNPAAAAPPVSSHREGEQYEREGESEGSRGNKGNAESASTAKNSETETKKGKRGGGSDGDDGGASGCCGGCQIM